MQNVRYAIVTALTKSDKSKGYSNLVLNAFLNDNNFSPQDSALAARIIYGVVERKITLDYFIEKSSGRPLNKISLFLLNNLRVAIYQILYMDKIPDSAAVNEAVNIVKHSKEVRAAGFCNAVLRNFLRETPKFPQGSTDYALSIKYSCEKWYIHELKQHIGQNETEQFLKNSLETPPTYIRVNTTKTTQKELTNRLTERGVKVAETGFENALSISFRGALGNLDEFNSGLFHIQDLASQFAIKTLDINENDTVLDVCAAPGGKSATAAQYAFSGNTVSCDLYDSRVGLIKENAERLFLQNIKATLNDASVYNKNLGQFDKIICDVPCSGFGVIRRKPEIKYKDYNDLTNLPDLQYNILSVSAKYLKRGGRLLYSTCTLRSAENEDVVNRFLKEHKEFKAVKTKLLGNFSEFHRLLPQTHNSDGFFFTVLSLE